MTAAVTEAAMQPLVLLVDDNAAIVRALEYGLRRSGFRVLTAFSGAQSMEILHGPEGPGIDAILSDVMMPGGMNGIELARTVRQIRPTLPILLTSGYATGVFESLGADPAEFPLMAKPSSVSDLAAALRRMIAQARS